MLIFHLTNGFFCVNLVTTYATVSPLTVAPQQVTPGAPPNAGLLFCPNP
jgi:hypothetical protein